MSHLNAQNLYFHMAHILIKVKLSSLQSTSSKYRQLTPCTESYMGWFQQKKKPEIAVIFLHSSLTAQNWAIISNLTAPLSLGQVIRTIMTSIIIITILMPLTLLHHCTDSQNWVRSARVSDPLPPFSLLQSLL